MKYTSQPRALVSILDQWLIFISLILCQVQASVLGSEDSLLKLTCTSKRTETVFPAIRHSDSFNSTAQQTNDVLLLLLKWRRMNLELVLHPNDVTLPQTHSEWTRDNITYAKFRKRRCLYSGYVKSQSSSHAALSLCSGVSGYIQTDTELLFVQPKSKNSLMVGPSAHVLYTCEPQRSPSNLEMSTPDSHERHRRSTQKSKYLEVALVVDNNIVEEVGSKDKAVDYIMALMNIVNTVYQHHSLGVDIKVVVSKMIFLTKSQQKEVVDKRDALRTVNMFCDWSSKQMRPTDYDVSVLITEADFGPAGYAPLSSLCQPTRSCAAVRDEGFLTAFVIAHEIAHVFGIYHDGHGNHCYGRKYESAMMATQVMSKLNHFWWSDCSSTKMKAVIKYLPCLNNEHKSISNHYPLKPDSKLDTHIGKPWSLDFQCRMEFGYNFKFCTSVGESPCSVLWCSNASYPYHCRTKRGPPLPGTSCGHDKECHNEVCKYVGNKKPVNGNWSSWTQWTFCSTDCGVGLKHRTRTCNNPEPEFGGTPCEGETSEWDTCLNTKCENYEDGKQKDCDNWDHIQIRYGTHKWQAFEGQNDSSLCLQTCKSFYTDEVVTLDVLVENGTPCGYTKNISNICMNGKCITVGCDGKINSTLIEDQCGVCGGNGSQCKVISGHFSQKPRSGEEYMTVLTLPVNARHVKIINNKQSSHFLALQDPRYGTFYLNGDKRQSKDKKFVMNGAMFEYFRSTKNNETISTNGPVRRNIKVMVYSNKFMNETDIFYSYAIHKDDNSYEINKYAWKFDKWSDCSVTCGAGKHIMLHICYDKDNGQRVDDDKCLHLKAPRRDEVPCQRDQCSAVPNHSYNYGMENTYGECNATCGQLGIQVQKFHCEKHFTINDTYVQVPQKFCDHLSKPYHTQICQGKPCQNMERFQWASSNWSKCYCESGSSKSFKWREIWCEQVTVSDNKETIEKADLTKCQDVTNKPEEIMTCPLTSCIPQLRWKTGSDFGPCNAKCGETGEEKTIILCEFENKNGTVDMIDISRCEQIIKPTPASRSCTADPCEIEQKLFTWMPLDEWSDCDAACNQNGTHLRLYVCQEIITHNDHINVSSSQCDINTRPDERKECQGLPCTLKWQLGEWSECSVTCGKGKHYRKVFCGDPISDHDDNRCLETPPPMSKICNMKECPEQSDEDCVNMHSYCSAYKDLNTRCKRDNFKRKCCRVCLDYERSANRRLSPLQLLIKRRGLQKVKRISS
ncbi:A disintegrin and metalloproteinase with thrombospondin motifs 3 [Bulinus truncatus]|nr:A disintegrin and metalloproteinase with thrombospondin motifs 3 [Bulinus truncatus]